MSLTLLQSRAQLGMEAPEVSVEVHISNGLPNFTVVGLPETAVREARDRVRSAILNTGFEFPARRITVNLAPANLPKEGGRYDLPIALGILAASKQINIRPLDGFDCYGELALSGSCRGIEGLLPALIASKQAQQAVIIPEHNLLEASLVRDLPIHLASSLGQLCASMNAGQALPSAETGAIAKSSIYAFDLIDVYGQYQAKRALEIAASGGHHMLMMGPPGTGKSMLAQRLVSILPPMSEAEAMSTASIRSLCHKPVNPENWLERPFQSPHHTVSGVALVGGGSKPRPGEISLAHNGVLFLDELTEFDRRSIEVIRQPLESGQIHISRASGQAQFPARFQLVAAMNPCPGGCDSIALCECSVEQLGRYRNKLSAPLLDRIDIQIELARLERHELVGSQKITGDSSEQVRSRVIEARQRQIDRQGCVNAYLDNRDLDKYCELDSSSEQLLLAALEKLRLTARSYHKLLKLARTIADLAGEHNILQAHVAEATSYRRRQA